MKKYLLSLVFIAVPIIVFAENVSFVFPFKPGDAKWNEYETNKERVAALQIPNTIIDKLTTRQLLDACLNYPYLIEITMFKDYQKGVDIMASKFNGLKELMERDDLLDLLIEKELKLETEYAALSNAKSEEKGLFSFQSLFVDLLLDRIVEKKRTLSSETIEEIKEICESNKILRSRYPATFSSINEIPTQDILSKSLFAKSANRSQKSGPNYQSVTIYTPKGSQVPDANELTSGDITFSDDQIAQWNSHLYYSYDHATLVEGGTCRYNAAGWTWCKSETDQDVSIFNYSDRIYVTDGSYVEVPKEIATKVVYGDFYHSATIVDSLWYESKWGDGGPLVRHKLTAVPDGTDIFFSPIMTNFHPSAPKHFFMLQPTYTINGTQYIFDSEVYSIPNLPSGYTVTWSLSDSHYNQYCLQQNYPVYNQCTITKDYNSMVNATLTATITYQGYTITTATKLVTAVNGFMGTYNYGYGSHQINYPYPLYVSVGSTVDIHSPNMIGASVSYETQYASIPSSWYFNSNTGFLRVGMPAGSNVPPVIVYVASNGSNYTLPIIPSSNLIMLVTMNGEILNVEMSFEGERNIQGNDEKDKDLWEIVVTNAMTGENVYKSTVSDSAIQINTSLWKSGFYIVQGKINSKIYSEKIYKK